MNDLPLTFLNQETLSILTEHPLVVVALAAFIVYNDIGYRIIVAGLEINVHLVTVLFLFLLGREKVLIDIY